MSSALKDPWSFFSQVLVWAGLYLGAHHTAGCRLITQGSGQMSSQKGLLGHPGKSSPLAIVLSNHPLLISSEQALGSEMISLITSFSNENGSHSVTELCQGHPGPLASGTHSRTSINAASLRIGPLSSVMLLYCMSPVRDPLPSFPAL